MQRKVKKYQGKEVTEEILNRLFYICNKRNFRIEGMIPYSDIYNINGICMWLECQPDNFHIILGEDWFITYLQDDIDLEIIDWVALDNVENKITQTLEMKKYIIELLLESRKKQIYATMRHTTSYKFYELFKKHGYIKEEYNTISYEETIPTDGQKIIFQILKKYHKLSSYFQDPNRVEYPEYEEYFNHDVTFYVTDEFIKKYTK